MSLKLHKPLDLSILKFYWTWHITDTCTLILYFSLTSSIFHILWPGCIVLLSAAFSLRNCSPLFLSYLYSVSSLLKVYFYDFYSASSHNTSFWPYPWHSYQPRNMTILLLTCCTKISWQSMYIFSIMVLLLCFVTPCLLKLVKFCK